VVHELSRQQARRIAVRAQLLAAPRPTDLLEVVRHLTLLQVDLTAAVAPSADVVCWSRLGSSYSPADLEDLLADGSLVEHRLRLRPAEDLSLLRGQMRRDPQEEYLVARLEWAEANRACHADILEALRQDGPLPASALPDTCVVPWRSSGWTNEKNTQRLVNIMEQRGEVAVAGRDGAERLWDLAERVLPDDEVVPPQEAARIRDRRRLVALGIARPTGPADDVEPGHVGLAGEEAVVEGLRGRWRVEPTYLEGSFRGRTALLSPLDRLVMDRKRMTDIFGFDYQLEMYKPVARRRWGYWAMPVLHGDRLVGKLDASTDQAAGVLRVHALHEDVPFTKTMRAAVDREVRDLAAWLEVDLVWEQGRRVTGRR
jgi:uncharacterized protein YcaQ